MVPEAVATVVYLHGVYYCNFEKIAVLRAEFGPMDGLRGLVVVAAKQICLGFLNCEICAFSGLSGALIGDNPMGFEYCDVRGER